MQPNATATPFALGLSPKGRVISDLSPPTYSTVSSAFLADFRPRLAENDADALVDLAAREPSTLFPASIAFFRDLAVSVLASAASSPAGRPTCPTDWQRTIERAPPMLGHENLNPGTLTVLWTGLAAALDDAVFTPGNSLADWLAARNPRWAVVGRVCFHLAENRRDEARPFAFLATYSVGLSGSGAAQHRPLGQALAESAASGEREALLNLLLPVVRAADSCEWLKALVDTQAIFRPQAWTAAQAHRFLLSVPGFEAAGLVVRVPDWWRAAAPARVQVSVALGGDAPSTFGAAGLLSFNIGFAVDGEPIDEAEWLRLRAAGSGLVSLRGRWVEVDQQRLAEVLGIWNEAKAEAGDGVPFHKAMRMLAGAETPSGLTPAENEEDRAWSRVVAGPWLEGVLRGLRDPSTAGGELPGKSLLATLRPYQEDGVRWLGFLNQLGLGACLADDMGLGKTIQVLALFLVLKRRKLARGPHLLVVPASLLGNWRGETTRFAPSLSMEIAHSSGDAAAAENNRNADVVLTTYGTLVTAAWMKTVPWDTVILDEAQAIKNPATKQTRAVCALQARARLALTGTPVENRAGDLWSLFHFLQPGLLGSAGEFRKFADSRADSPARWGPLRKLVSPYLLRRLKTDPTVAPDLPAKTEMTAECGLSREQAVLYQTAVDDLARALDEAEGMARRGLVLASLLRFKQICNHPSHWLADGGWQTPRSGKLLRLAEIIEPIAQRQEKMLVFSQFREAVEPLSTVLAEWFGRPGLVLHGGTPIGQRQELVNRFQDDDEIPFVVLSLKAGGTGLNLTAATHVVHFDRWWNPAVEEQATDRAFRIGQKRPVFVHKMVCRGTVEEKVDALLGHKRGLARELLTGGDEVRLTELSNDELLRTVSLDLGRATLD